MSAISLAHSTEVLNDFEKCRLLWQQYNPAMVCGEYSQCSLWDKSLKQNSLVERLRNGGKRLPSVFIMLSGETGSGKTFCAVAYAARWAAKVSGMYGSAVQTKYVTHADLGAMVGVLTPEQAETLRRLKQAPILILDDLRGGNEANAGKGVIALIEDLLDTRLKTRKQTLITTNLGGEDFAKTYGERVMSRLNKSCTVIQSPPVDYRKAITINVDWDTGESYEV